MNSRQTFFIKKDGKEEVNFEAEHLPARLDLDYYIIFKQNGVFVKIGLYELKRIMRIANKNIKEMIL